MEDLDVAEIAKGVYGNVDEAGGIYVGEDEEGHWDQGVELKRCVERVEVPPVPEMEEIERGEAQQVPEVEEIGRGDDPPVPGMEKIDGGAGHKHFTRSKGRVMAVTERPPKPQVPRVRDVMREECWRKAMARELEKINEEETIFELPRDANGEFIMPEDAIRLRMFEILDYKWKSRGRRGGWRL